MPSGLDEPPDRLLDLYARQAVAEDAVVGELLAGAQRRIDGAALALEQEDGMTRDRLEGRKPIPQRSRTGEASTGPEQA